MRLAGRDPEAADFRLRLRAGPHLFTDWRYVMVADVWDGFRWVERNSGDRVPLRVYDDKGEYAKGKIDAVMAPDDVPLGIRLAAQPGSRTDPRPHDGPPGMTLLQDGARLRTWGFNGWGFRRNVSRFDGAVYCAESDDGFEWRNRQVCAFDFSACPDASAREPPTVFIDPAAAADERYKMVFLGHSRAPEYAAQRRALLDRWLAQQPDAIDPTALSMLDSNTAPQFDYARYGAVSEDGVMWRVLPDPLLFVRSDAQNVVYYDEAQQTYVWYLKSGWPAGRRCIARAETADFRRWPQPQVALLPPTHLGPDADWYTSSKTVYPGAPDHHLMFPTLYRHTTDDAELRVYSGPDGMTWNEVPGGPVLEPGPDSAWDGGFFTAGHGLVPLGGDQVGLPLSTSAWPHKYPRNRETMESQRTAYVVWPRERLVALEAAGEGRFATMPLIFTGRRLRLNVRTRRAGEIRVEVGTSRPDGGFDTVLPGHSFADCRPIVGDSSDHVVGWRDGDDLGHGKSQALTFRFQLRAAQLFSFEFV